tara:strand:- start:187 stop:1035 length:849 start_codon:yes stop_codon:yes gene_type:complete
MALFNRLVECEKDTNVHSTYPDWYDGGKTTLTAQGGSNPIHNLLKFKYSTKPNFGDGELHSAKLLIYPTALAVTNEYEREISIYKIYKLKQQLENEGSLDAHTTDVLAYSIHKSEGSVYKEDKLVGVDLDGDGVPELGENITIKGGRTLQYSKPYLTIDDAADLKDGLMDSFWGGKDRIKDYYGQDLDGETVVYLKSSAISGRLAAISNGDYDKVLEYSMGHLSFEKTLLQEKGVIKYGRVDSFPSPTSIAIANVVTADTSLFNKVKHSESKYIGKREVLSS